MIPEPTERLRFREMTDADLDDIATLEIHPSRTPQEWIAWTRRNYAEHGFGLWVVETHDGGFVGDCGLTMQQVEGSSLLEAGWRVRSDLRRRGFASEAGRAVRALAAREGYDHLIAIIRPDNLASQAVAVRIGLALEREARMLGETVLIFGAALR